MNFSERVTQLRKEKKMSLQELSHISGVSKSMISKIEREEKNPTLQVASQIAEALGSTLSELLSEPQEKETIVIKKEDQIAYYDELSGFQRIMLSPLLDTHGIEFIKNIMPIGCKSPHFPPHREGVKEYIVVAQGCLEIQLGSERYMLSAGDSIYYKAAITHHFINIGNEECRYYLIIDSTSL